MKVQTPLAPSFAFSLISSLLVNLEGSTDGYLSIVVIVACVTVASVKAIPASQSGGIAFDTGLSGWSYGVSRLPHCPALQASSLFPEVD